MVWMGGGLFCFVLHIEKETAYFQRGEPNVGADSISARGRLRRGGVRRGEGTPPYGRPGGYSRPVWPGVCHDL